MWRHDKVRTKTREVLFSWLNAMCADYELVAGAGFVSVFVGDAASLELVELVVLVVPEVVLESEPAPVVELVPEVVLESEPAPAVSLDLPVDVPEVAVLPEAALSVL